MNIKFGELWNCIKSYPHSLSYYDESVNEEDMLYTEAAMNDFAEEHSEDEVTDFAIYESGLSFKLEVDLRKERNRCLNI